MAARLAPTVRVVVVDERSPLVELDWTGTGVRLTPVGARDVATAAGAMWDAVTEGRVRHRGQVELSAGVLGARQRPMLAGPGFGWDRKAPGSSTLIAATLALWGVDAAKVKRPSRTLPGVEVEERAVVLY